MPNKKIVVWGATYTNKGSLAMLYTLREVYKNAEITIVCDHKSDEKNVDNEFELITGLYSIKSYLNVFMLVCLNKLSFGFFYKENKVIRAMKNIDIFIDLSGFALTEDFSKNSCTYRSAKYLIQACISRIFSKQYYIYPQAVGPMVRNINKIMFKLILMLATKVYIRGRRSYDFAKRYKKNNLFKTNDLVFLNESYRIKTKREIQTKYVVVNPNSRIFIKEKKENKNDYIKNLISIVEDISKNYFVVLTPNELRENEYDDLDICYEILSNLSDSVKKHVKVNTNLNIEFLLSLCEYADFCIVSRFHLMIFCLLKGNLPVVMSWSEKYLDIMEEFNISQFVFSQSELKAEFLKIDEIELLKNMIHDRSNQVFEEMQGIIKV